MSAIVWFKNDLRLHDNETLCKAISENETLILVYIVDNRLFALNNLGFRKAGINRYKFLKQSVESLKINIKDSKGILNIKYGIPEEEILKIIESQNVKKLYFEQEYASEELNSIQYIKDHVKNSIEIIPVWGKTLYHIEDIPFKIEDIPLTSKAYRIPTGKTTAVRVPFALPQLNLAKYVELNDAELFPIYTTYNFSKEEYDFANPFLIGGESTGLKRLQEYSFGTESLTSYRWTRNRSLGLDYSSKFSPYLALGCLSPREIYKVIKEYEQKITKNQSTWWLVFELVWRDYFTFKGMRMGNAIFKTEGYKNKQVAFENNKNLFKRWCEGKTGIPFIDAHMRQLNATGYMSNRGRVNCASFLVHDYKIDWTWGAAYFESRLIDYDVSANWMNWHVQAYEIYYTNPIHQSLKYKAQDYIKKWIPELSDIKDNYILAPWLLENRTSVNNYPEPHELFSKWNRSINRIIKTLEDES